MKIITLSLTTLLLFSFSLKADVVKGTFQTEKSDEGNYLHVKFGPCHKDKNLTCGKIKGSFLSNGSKNKNSKITGELIVWNMVYKGNGQYTNGKIWDPSSNNDDGSKKIYNSKMNLSGNTLSVSGCILVFCKAQNWTKVN